MAKGALPVALAYYVFGVSGWGLMPVMLAPILGHAYSPFLRFKGGKAIAVTFGVWTALTVPFGPFVMAFSLLALNRIIARSRLGGDGRAARAARVPRRDRPDSAPSMLAAWAGTTADPGAQAPR